MIKKARHNSEVDYGGQCSHCNQPSSSRVSCSFCGAEPPADAALRPTPSGRVDATGCRLLPSCVTTARALRRHPDVPRRAKVALLVAVVWVVSPIDLLPEF